MLKFVFNASSLSRAMGVVLVLGITGTTEAKSPPTVTKLVSLDPAAFELPESITTDDDGRVFFSLVNGQIRELLPNKSTITIATVPVPTGGNMIGIKVGPDRLIYTTTASLSPTDLAAFVWRTDPDTGIVEKFATLDPNGFPNDMAFEDDGSFFVTDSFLGRLYHIDPSGNATVAVSDPLLRGNPADQAFPTHDFGVNGIAWDQAKQNLYLGVTDYGRVVRIPFSCHGRLGRPKVVVESAQLKGIDGVALDRHGTVYAAVNTQNLIATVERGYVSVYAQSPLFDGPSSIAFGTARGDKKTAYITNFAISNVLAGLPAHPAILSLPVPVPGADLR